jgi:hypothetical protein
MSLPFSTETEPPFSDEDIELIQFYLHNKAGKCINWLTNDISEEAIKFDTKTGQPSFTGLLRQYTRVPEYDQARAYLILILGQLRYRGQYEFLFDETMPPFSPENVKLIHDFMENRFTKFVDPNLKRSICFDKNGQPYIDIMNTTFGSPDRKREYELKNYHELLALAEKLRN